MNVTDMITEIVATIEYASYSDVENDIETKGYKIISELDPEESIGSFSTDVDWDGNMIVEKDSKQFNIYFSGTAIGDISYDRWVDSYGHDICDFEVNPITKSK